MTLVNFQKVVNLIFFDHISLCCPIVCAVLTSSFIITIKYICYTYIVIIKL